MAQILRVKLNWTGFIGSPGYTNLYFRDFSEGPVDQAMADGAVAKTDIWLDAWVPALPSTVSLLVDPTVDIVNEQNGELEGFLTTSPDTSRLGTGSGAYSAPSGICVNWSTNGIRNGRRIRGRTFMVPVSGAATDTNGTIATTHLNNLRTASGVFISPTGAGDLGVWSRPTPAEPNGGIWHVAASYSIPDRLAVLRSRRD